MKILASPYREHSDENPVVSLLYDSLEKCGVRASSFSMRKLLRGSWDLWHLHWPAENIVGRKHVRDIVPRLLMFWAALKMARLKKTKIFWTVHNISPHERIHPVLERLFWRVFLPNIDAAICMSESGKRELFRHHHQMQSIPVFTIPHGHYRGAYPDQMGKGEARAALGLPPDDFVVAFIGLIRAYKGVLPLIRSFVEAQCANTTLLIAGMANESMKRELTKAAGPGSNVRLVFEFVDRKDIQKYLRAADLVILPFIEILNSGSAILALSFDRPVLVPARGALAELREIVGPLWVRHYDGEISPEIIRAAIEWAKARQIQPDERAPLDALNWERIAKLTIQAFSYISSSAPQDALNPSTRL